LLGNRTGIRPVKASASKPLGMGVYVGVRGTSTTLSIYPMGMKSFGLSYDDTEERIMR